LLNLKKGLAKSVSLEEKPVKFDEVGVLAFGERLGLKELFWKSCAHFVKVLMEYTETFSTHHMI